MGRKSILGEAREKAEQEGENEQSETEPEPESNGTNSGPDGDQDDTDQEEEIKAWTHRAPEPLVDRLDSYVEQDHRFHSRMYAINHILQKHLDEEGVED